MNFDPNTVIGFSTNDLRVGKHSREEIESVVRFHLPDLQVPSGENAFAIVMAICSVESNFGKDDGPRFEPTYSRSSIYFSKDKLLQSGHSIYGDHCAHSYGPFQIMWYNAALLGYPLELSPSNLWSPVISLPFVIEYLNKCPKYGAQTALDIFAQYNGGWGILTRKQMPDRVIRYIKKASLAYEALKSKAYS